MRLYAPPGGGGGGMIYDDVDPAPGDDATKKLIIWNPVE